MVEIDDFRDTISIEKNVHEIYKQLTDGNDPINIPFRTMKDVFMWAMCLGMNSRERKPLIGKKESIFRWAQFSEKTDIPLIKAAAITSKEEIDVLLDRDQILHLAEEYANSGIHEVQSYLFDDYGQPLWNLVDLLRK